MNNKAIGKSLIILLLVVLILLFIGCMTVYIVTETDPLYSASPKGSRYYIFIPDDLTIRERKLSIALARTLRNNGFAVVDNLIDSDLVVIVSSDSHVYESQVNISRTRTATTSGYVGGAYYTGQTQYTENIPIAVSTLNYQISIALYTWKTAGESEELHINQVWNGYFDAPAEYIEKDPEPFLKKILERFGLADFRGFEYWEIPQ